VRSGGPNRFAVGAEVEISAGGLSQRALADAQPSYLSTSSFDLTFGLGRHAEVERLTVRFPGGAVKTLHGVAADRLITVEE
jgi:hypothetical protein